MPAPIPASPIFHPTSLEPTASKSSQMSIQSRVIEVMARIVRLAQEMSNLNKASSITDNKEHKSLTKQQVSFKQIQGAIPLSSAAAQFVLTAFLPGSASAIELGVGSVTKFGSSILEIDDFKTGSKKELVSIKLSNGSNDTQQSSSMKNDALNQIRELLQISTGAARSN